MPTKPQDKQQGGQQQQDREILNSAIGQHVIKTLGQPGDLHKLEVRHLWKDNYRVNVFIGADAETGELRLDGPSGQRSATHDVLIGADGAYSALRDAIVKSERADYRQDHLPWGYKELTIARDRSGGFALDPGALHIWPRGDSMMIALPNPDQSFTATLFWPYDGPAGFSGLDTADAVRRRFERD